MAPISSEQLSQLHRNLLQLPREILDAHLLHPRDTPSLEARNDGIPTQTLSAVKRQYTTVAIPATYAGLNSGPAPGTIIGIVLGSVAGFVLIVWLLWTLANYSGSSAITAESIEVVRERHRSRSPHSHSRRSRRSRRTVEVRERSPLPPPPRRDETIIVEERRHVSPPPMVRETVIVEERHREPRVEGDDIVEVIEEGSISPRPARRESSRRSRRTSGGFRSVDPNQFGGGDYPRHHIRRDESSISSMS